MVNDVADRVVYKKLCREKEKKSLPLHDDPRINSRKFTETKDQGGRLPITHKIGKNTNSLQLFVF